MKTLSADKLKYLLEVVQDLSLARTQEAVSAIVRVASRRLTGSDGATFVLRDGDLCHYADEDAISPLWKGMRFPMSACISGWVMLNRQPTAIKDIYADARIPADAYRPTFVKSLAMVPIRTKEPIGALGNYWASEREISAEELHLAQALADSTSIALENVQLYNELEKKVIQRTAELQAFTYAVSHDLKAPVRGISGFAGALEDEFGPALPAGAREYVGRIRGSSARLTELIEALLKLSQLSRVEFVKRVVNLSEMARQIADELRASDPARRAEVVVQDGLLATGDQAMLRAVLENLIRNAWKFTRHADGGARIEIGCQPGEGRKTIYYVKDNGAGFDASYAGRLFQAFQRLHSTSEFEGTGIGLATVQRIVSRHDGRVWATSEVGKGAQFFFELPG